MTNVDIVKILQIGVVGLGFLLALLAFRLLRHAQGSSSPSKPMVNPVYVFMLFSFALCILGLVPEALKHLRSEDQKAIEIDELTERLASITEKFSKTCEHIRTTNWLDNSPEARKSLSAWCGN